MEWSELTVTVSKKHADEVAEHLIEQGSNGIVEEACTTNPEMLTLKAYLKNDAGLASCLENIRGVLTALNESLPQELCSELAIDSIPDEDWNKKWKSFFEPIKVTRRIVIKPSWRNYRKHDDEVVIELDPGMAFGTGTHPSTRMCLEAIEDLTGSLQAPASSTLLDVGTGSGILAIAGALLGVGRVEGIDNDHLAVGCAVKNAKNNKASENVTLSTTPLKKLEGAYDIVVANILPHVLIDMKELLVARMKPGGFLVLSGILIEKAPEVIAAFVPEVSLQKELHEEEWACLILKKG